MIEVRIRDNLDTESTHLANIPFDKIDSIIPTINSWGLYTDDLSPEEIVLAGQFRFSQDSGRAFFEITVAVSDD